MNRREIEHTTQQSRRPKRQRSTRIKLPSRTTTTMILMMMASIINKGRYLSPSLYPGIGAWTSTAIIRPHRTMRHTTTCTTKWNSNKNNNGNSNSCVHTSPRRPRTMFSLLSSSCLFHSSLPSSSEDILDIQDTTMEERRENKSNVNLLNNWRDFDVLNPTLQFETVIVPAPHIGKYINHPFLEPRLAKATNWDFLKHVHPRIKVVQEYSEGDNTNDDSEKEIVYKQLLLLPSSVANATTDFDKEEEKLGWDNLLASVSDHDNKNDDNDATAAANTTPTIQQGPKFEMKITYEQLSFQYIVNHVLPVSVLPAPASYEQIGHIAHFNLKPHHVPYGPVIGDILLSTTTGRSSKIRTVVNKVGQVHGDYRTYECAILADQYHRPNTKNNTDSKNTTVATNSSSSSSSLETTVIEDGVAIQLNVAECYWCTRLSGERQALIHDILATQQSGALTSKSTSLVVADVFCGAGAVCLLLAQQIKDQHKVHRLALVAASSSSKKKKETTNGSSPPPPPVLTILANDWNPKAIKYLTRSIHGNNMKTDVPTSGSTTDPHKNSMLDFKLSCRDSYDFLSELGQKVVKTTTLKPRRRRRIGTIKNYNTQTKNGNQENEENNENRVTAAAPVVEIIEDRVVFPDHVLMNFPLDGPKFLGSLRWWSWKRLEKEITLRNEDNDDGTAVVASSWIGPRFHVYTFARSTNKPPTVTGTGPHTEEEEVAVTIIAEQLLPSMVPAATRRHETEDLEERSTTTSSRRQEMDAEFDTQFSTRMVRDVAPGKVVVCVSFFVTPKLIRHMQGDFS